MFAVPQQVKHSITTITNLFNFPPKCTHLELKMRVSQNITHNAHKTKTHKNVERVIMEYNSK